MNSRQRYLSRICPSVLLAVCMLIGAVACAGQGSTGDATSGNATQSATATGEIATTGGSTETEPEQITTGEETSGAEQEETMPGRFELKPTLEKVWHAPDNFRFMDPLPPMHRRGIIIAASIRASSMAFPVPSERTARRRTAPARS